MNIFYSPHATLNNFCELDESESQHLTKVLRKRTGEELYLFDGKGSLYLARLTEAGKKTATVQVFQLVERREPPTPKLHIAIALPKNIERFEWFAEKATEIGIAEITPMVCRHSERKDLRTDRIEKVLLSACKQSKHLFLPRLNPVMRFDEVVASVNHGVRKYIAYCDEKAIHLQQAYHGGFDAVVLVGPEGDFAKEEVLIAEKKEYETVSLGKSRLRLETAGIYIATVFNLANET